MNDKVQSSIFCIYKPYVGIIIIFGLLVQIGKVHIQVHGNHFCEEKQLRQEKYLYCYSRRNLIILEIYRDLFDHSVHQCVGNVDNINYLSFTCVMIIRRNIFILSL